MQKRAPTLANILVIVTFVLACFGLLLFLWESFGGPVPLKPKGYRFYVNFPNGLQLAEQSDVRISGVPVGRVVTVKQSEGKAQATVEMDSRYAPVRANVTAQLREKTLLGETYVQLVPHGNLGPYLPDGGTLPQRKVQPSVTLDEVLSTFNARTRAYFRAWQQTWAASFRGRGEDINSFFASLEPFVDEANKIVRLLNTQEQAVSALIRNTGIVFNALGGRDHQLEGLIVNGEHTFRAAASASQAFAAAWRALPGFESSSTKALRAIDSFQTDAIPYLNEFRATEIQLAPTLRALDAFAPHLEHLLTALGGWANASKRGLPAFDRSLELTTPILKELTPVLRNLNPFLQYLGDYEPELQSFFANLTATTNGRSGNENVTVPGQRSGIRQHYLRGMNVLTPEGLAVFQQAIGTYRSNPYFQPGAFNLLSTGLPVFNASTCADSAPSLTGPPNETVSEETIKALRGEPFTIQTERVSSTTGKLEVVPKLVTIPPLANKEPSAPNQVAAPPCRQQEPFVFNGVRSQFPHVTEP